MSDLIAKMLQACDGVAPNLYADLLVIRDETERLEARVAELSAALQYVVENCTETPYCTCAENSEKALKD